MQETPQQHNQMTSQAALATAEPDEDRREHLCWMHELQTAQEVFKDYHARCDTITKRYRDDRPASDDVAQTALDKWNRKYNALWSMAETLKPLLFSAMPVPYCQRWHDDSDRPSADAALILQRALKVMIGGRENYDTLEESVGDYVLHGRGTTWVTYVPEFAVRESEVPEYVDSEDEIPEDEYPGDVDDGTEKPKYKARKDERGTYFRRKIEYKAKETCELSVVSNKDFLHGPAVRWRDVPWVARRRPMLREELIRRFGKKLGAAIPLAMHNVGDNRLNTRNTDDFKGAFARAEVWEVWDRSKREIVWICPQYTAKILDRKKDKLELGNFFPCAKPMFGTMTTDTMVPVPDYCEWQSIALELDDITMRIAVLTSALRVVGVYSAEYGIQLKKLLDPKHVNEMIEVDGWAMFAEKGGLKGAVDFFPVETVIAVLEKLYEARQRLVAELYEITGISDIVRGASDPRETAAAQKLKGGFANSRLSKRQKLVARHAEEILEIKAGMLCTVYSDDTIMRLSSADALFRTPAGEFDVARWNGALAILRNEPLRVLKVQISNETLAGDVIENAKAEAKEFLEGMSSIMSSSVELLTLAPKMGRVVGKMIMFAVRKFRVGRELEADFEREVTEALSNIQPPPAEGGSAGPAPITPEEIQIKFREVGVKEGQLEVEKGRLGIEQSRLELDKGKVGGELHVKTRDVAVKEFKAHADAQKAQAEVQIDAQQAQADTQLAAADQQHAHQMAERDSALAERGQQFSERQHDDGMMERHVDRNREDQRFATERSDAQRGDALDRAERVAEGDRADRNAAEDRKVKAQAARSKAKPKS